MRIGNVDLHCGQDPVSAGRWRARRRPKLSAAPSTPTAPSARTAAVPTRADHEARQRHADGLTEEEARRERRDGGAASVRRHLGRVDLQRVVQHVEAEPEQEARADRPTPRRRQPDREQRDAHQPAAPSREARFTKLRDEPPRRDGEAKPPRPNSITSAPAADSDKPEPHVHVSRDERERPEQKHAFEKHDDQDQARPRARQHAGELRQRSAAAMAAGRLVIRACAGRRRLNSNSRWTRRRKGSRSGRTGAPRCGGLPPAAEPHTRAQSEDLADQEPREHRLALRRREPRRRSTPSTTE